MLLSNILNFLIIKMENEENDCYYNKTFRQTVPRSSGYVIPMSVMADMLSACNLNKKICIIRE